MDWHSDQMNANWLVRDLQFLMQKNLGLWLCKQQNRLVAEYALSGIDKPIGVAEYQLLRDLPATLEQSLPSIADIEAELANEVGALDALDALDAPGTQP